jgi:hypothetical protein
MRSEPYARAQELQSRAYRFALRRSSVINACSCGQTSWLQDVETVPSMNRGKELPTAHLFLWQKLGPVEDNVDRRLYLWTLGGFGENVERLAVGAGGVAIPPKASNRRSVK